MSDNINIKNKFLFFVYSYFLMIIGVGIINIGFENKLLMYVLIATLLIYTPVLLRLYQHAGTQTNLGRTLTVILNCLIVFGELLAIIGSGALVFGIFAGVATGGFGLLGLASIPLMVSAALYMYVSFGIKKGDEVLYSVGIIAIAMITLVFFISLKYRV